MTTLTLTKTHGPALATRPGLGWRGALRRLVALDALVRERADMQALDDRALADVGVRRADLDAALGRPREHYRLILLRGGDQL
jgi:uncharacterized protein YjiS (DUF1127 family)